VAQVVVIPAFGPARCPRERTSWGVPVHLAHRCSRPTGPQDANARVLSLVFGLLKTQRRPVNHHSRGIRSPIPMSRRWTTWVSQKPHNKHVPLLCDLLLMYSSSSNNNSSSSSNSKPLHSPLFWLNWQ